MKPETKKQANILSQVVIDAIGAAVVAVEAADNALYGAAVALYDAGFTAANLDKDHGQHNAELVKEVRLAIIAKFPANARDTIVRSMKDIKATTKDEADLRHLYKAKLRNAFAAIRKNLAKVEELVREGGRKAVTLHEVLDEMLARGIQRIQKNKGDKGEPLEVLLAAFKDCRAKCNAAFKGATK